MDNDFLVLSRLICTRVANGSKILGKEFGDSVHTRFVARGLLQIPSSDGGDLHHFYLYWLGKMLTRK
jgi:hypothetical protein